MSEGEGCGAVRDEVLLTIFTFFAVFSVLSRGINLFPFPRRFTLVLRCLFPIREEGTLNVSGSLATNREMITSGEYLIVYLVKKFNYKREVIRHFHIIQ